MENPASCAWIFSCCSLPHSGSTFRTEKQAVMNDRQRIVLCVGLVVMAVMGLRPPWVVTFDNGYVHSRTDAGYGLVWDPPARPRGGITIDASRLAVMWVAVGLVTAVGLLLAGRRWSSPKSMRNLSVGDRVTSITCGNCGNPMTVTDTDGKIVHLHCPQCPHIKVVRHRVPVPVKTAKPGSTPRQTERSSMPDFDALLAEGDREPGTESWWSRLRRLWKSESTQ